MNKDKKLEGVEKEFKLATKALLGKYDRTEIIMEELQFKVTEKILKHYKPIGEATFVATKYKNNKVKVSWYDNKGNRLIPISEVEEIKEHYKEKIFHGKGGLFPLLREYNAYMLLGNDFWMKMVSITKKHFYKTNKEGN